MELSEEAINIESGTDTEYSDDSEDDPSFNIVEEAQYMLSNLSLKRRPKTLKSEGTDEKEDRIDHNLQDQNNYEFILKKIEGGHVDNLKVEQCKIYLRKHGLRLSGSKQILIQRIKEHIDIINCGGEKKYPPSSFVINCKGDTCTGDVVMFQQNVYDEFSIVTRRAKGGSPYGRRIVAGRILKESYGAAKQQHTFTIEVLWSTGEKPLHSLRPLLIKGRNLYRMNTMRQKWQDEGERQKILLEKHARGGAARLRRDERVQKKKLRERPKKTKEPVHAVDVRSDKPIIQPLIAQNCSSQSGHLTGSQFPNNYSSGSYNAIHENHDAVRGHIQTHPPTRIPLHPIQGRPPTIFPNSNQPGGSSAENRPPAVFPNSNHRGGSSTGNRPSTVFPNLNHQGGNSTGNPLQVFRPRNFHAYPPVQQMGKEQRQICWHFARGRCHFGERCKFLHETA